MYVQHGTIQKQLNPINSVRTEWSSGAEIQSTAVSIGQLVSMLHAALAYDTEAIVEVAPIDRHGARRRISNLRSRPLQQFAHARTPRLLASATLGILRLLAILVSARDPARGRNHVPVAGTTWRVASKRCLACLLASPALTTRYQSAELM